MQIFDKKGKKSLDEFYINDKIGIDEFSIGSKILDTPLIATSQFFGELIFINVYHKKTRMQYHILFNHVTNEIVD